MTDYIRTCSHQEERRRDKTPSLRTLIAEVDHYTSLTVVDVSAKVIEAYNYGHVMLLKKFLPALHMLLVHFSIF